MNAENVSGMHIVPCTSNHHEVGIVKEETSDTQTNKDGI